MANNLLPHGEEFLFVDDLLETNKKETRGTYTFKKSHKAFIAYSSIKIVPSFFILEALFQCGGAGARLLKTCDGFFGIAKVDSAKFLSPIEFDQQIIFKIQNTHLSKKTIKQSGKAYINNELIVEAQWVSINISLDVKSSVLQ